MVGTEVVGDHDLAFPEGRDEAVADVPLEARGGHRSVKPHEWSDAVEGEGRDHRLVLPAIGRDRRVSALTTRRPGVGRGVGQVAARLI